jgi:hypothetical protein
MHEHEVRKLIDEVLGKAQVMTDALTTALDSLTTSFDNLSTAVDSALTVLSSDSGSAAENTADAATITALQAQVDTLTSQLNAALGTGTTTAPTLVVSTVSAQTAPINTPFTLDLTSDISGGTPPYTVATSGLPVGLSVSGLVIAGTPTTAVVATAATGNAVLVQVTDSSTPPEVVTVSVDFTVA